jgi:hypothetical protein
MGLLVLEELQPLLTLLRVLGDRVELGRLLPPLYDFAEIARLGVGGERARPAAPIRFVGPGLSASWRVHLFIRCYRFAGCQVASEIWTKNPFRVNLNGR